MISQQLETALTELGLDSEDAYHMSRGEQLQLINQTTDSILTDHSLGELARLVQEENVRQKVEKSTIYDSIGMEKFYSAADPMQEITGAGINSNPEEIQTIEADLKRMNVEILYRPGNMAYAPGLIPGQPGQFIIDPNASYAAWRHEYKHFCDDRSDGFPGMRIFMDTEKCKQREIDAYNIEIELAKQLHRPDIVQRLEELKEKEISRYDSNAAYD